MLGKLMKHEFRATARIMLPVMGAAVAEDEAEAEAFAMLESVRNLKNK